MTQHRYAAAYHTHLLDCPKCKFGTLDRIRFKELVFWRCADCGAEYQKQELLKMGILKEAKA